MGSGVGELGSGEDLISERGGSGCCGHERMLGGRRRGI
jgi:hypothetical protein